MNTKAKDLPDEIFQKEMGILSRSLTQYANQQLNHLSWVDQFKTDREFDEALEEELDELFDGKPALTK